MIIHATPQVFSRRALDILRITEDLVGRIGDCWGNELRCHELARAVQGGLREAGHPRARVVDGRMGSIDHSWILLPGYELQAGSDRAPILDVYAPGRLPQVQLVDASWVISAEYVAGSERLDVRRDIVRVIMRKMAALPSAAPAGSQAIHAVDLVTCYTVPDISDVLDKLSGRPDLLRVILAAADELQRRFDAPRLTLHARDGARLQVVVDTTLEVAEAHDRMMRFLREWWWLRISVEDRITARLHLVQERASL